MTHAYVVKKAPKPVQASHAGFTLHFPPLWGYHPVSRKNGFNYPDNFCTKLPGLEVLDIEFKMGF